MRSPGAGTSPLISRGGLFPDTAWATSPYRTGRFVLLSCPRRCFLLHFARGAESACCVHCAL